MYDAFNKLSNTQGQDISYWDIGFIQFWNNGSFANGSSAFISKLFSGLPENTSVGDPTFSKNSPYIIAFDFIDNNNGSFAIYGANVETGDNNAMITNVGSQGWPNYSRLDNSMIYESPGFFGLNLYKVGVANNKIQAQGSISQFISDRNWGVWYGNGTRSLLVDAPDVNPSAFDMKLAPNPSMGNVQLSIDSKFDETVRISLVDMLGKILISRQADLQSGKNQIDLNINNFSAGQYLLRVEGKSGLGTKMLLKQ